MPRLGANLLTNAALALFGVTLAFVALEVVLRVGGTDPEVVNPLYSFHASDPDVGWIGRPGTRRRFVRADFAAIVEHDEQGFRRPLPPRPSEATEDILFLGDSFTWGWGVSQGEVFTDLLQREFAPRVAIYNRGICGFGTAQQLLLMRREMQARHYDKVVVMFTANDILDNHHSKAGRRPYFDLVGDRLVPRNQPPRRLMHPVRRFLKGHSMAFLWVDYHTGMLKRRWENERRGEEGSSHGATDAELRLLEQILVEMKESCAAAGTDLFFVINPDAAEIAARVSDVCRRVGVPSIDLSPIFAAQERAGEPTTFPADRHWNVAGHRLAADVLASSAILAERTRGP